MNPFDYEEGPSAVSQSQRLATREAPPPLKAGSSIYVVLAPESTEPARACTCLPMDDPLRVVRFLNSGRVYGYPGTNGGRLSNYLRFLSNNHPLISIFLVNKLHPYGVKQRVHVYYSVACLAILLNYLLLKTFYFPWIAMCTEPCTRTTQMSYCEGGYNDGLETTVYFKHCAFYSPSAISAAIGVALLPYGSLLRFIATCGCMKGNTFFLDHCLGRRMKAIVDYFGGSIMAFVVTISTAMFLAVVVECWVSGLNDWSLFDAFAQSKVYSALYWFVWSAPLFLVRFQWDRDNFARLIASPERASSSSETSVQSIA